MLKRYERSMVGAHVVEFSWNEYLDGETSEESIFCKGFLEVYIFGTGEHPCLEVHKFWHVICASPKLETDWSSSFDNGFLLLLTQNEATYEGIVIADATLHVGGELKEMQVAIIDFRLKNDCVLKKIVALHPDGTAWEIPDETMQ